MRALITAAMTLLLTGCGARDCMLDIAHRDCPVGQPAASRPPAAYPAAAFPQDDAICRSYGLTPGTRDYAICRRAKHSIRRQTQDESDYGFLRNPILPDVR